ncbi:MAG: site-specific integrase [Euryarchaeota archaeon]|nr:site-specific integrase [Euryarchaeota archaeon]
MRGVYEYPKDSGVWWIHYHDYQGKRHREKAGTNSAAIKLYHKRKTEALLGRKLPELLRRRPVTFDDLITDALEHSKRHHGVKTQAVAGWMLAVLRERFGKQPAEAITPKQVEEFLAERARTKTTSNRWRSLVSLLYRLGEDNGRVEVNPIRKVKRHRENNTRDRFLSADEEKKLRANIRELSPEKEPEFDLALYTGMRAGEQYGLQWRDVNLDLGLITIPRSKHGEKRFVRLNAAARLALARLRARYKHEPKGEHLVCPTEDHRQRRWFQECCLEAGVLNFRWHDLRHTFGSRLVMAGVDLRTVQELLGHRGITTTLRYAHLAPGHLQEAVERLNPTATRTATRRRTRVASRKQLVM